MRVLVTGANGFVGRWLVPRLLAGGHEVVALAGSDPSAEAGAASQREGLTWRPLDLDDPASLAEGLDRRADAVVHLAGLASVAESLSDAARAWQVNALGTVRLLELLEDICAGRGGAGHLGRIEALGAQMRAASLCGLGRTAPNTVLSTLRHFRDEYLAHLSGSCPARRCKALIRYRIGGGLRPTGREFRVRTGQNPRRCGPSC